MQNIDFLLCVRGGDGERIRSRRRLRKVLKKTISPARRETGREKKVQKSYGKVRTHKIYEWRERRRKYNFLSFFILVEKVSFPHSSRCRLQISFIIIIYWSIVDYKYQLKEEPKQQAIEKIRRRRSRKGGFRHHNRFERHLTILLWLLDQLTSWDVEMKAGFTTLASSGR